VYFLRADHSGLAVWDVSCLRLLECWDRGFESHSRHGCLCVYSVCVVLCVGSGLRRDDPPSKESYIDQEAEKAAKVQ
jgi:hypothetical protein